MSDPWYTTEVAAAVLDRLSRVEEFKSVSLYSVEVVATPFRVRIQYDPMDPVLIVDIAGDVGPMLQEEISRRANPQSIELRPAPPDEVSVLRVVLRSAQQAPMWRDLARTLEVLDVAGGATVATQPHREQDRAPEARPLHALARAAGQYWRPWRVWPVLRQFRIRTRSGPLTVTVPDYSTSWVARLPSGRAPVLGAATEVRWIPYRSGSGDEVVAAVWSSRSETSWGGMIPSLSVLVSHLDEPARSDDTERH